MIFTSQCTKCKRLIEYTTFEESKLVAPTCCGLPSVYIEDKDKIREIRDELRNKTINK